MMSFRCLTYSLFLAGWTAFAAEPPMLITIPHATKIPALDGKIDPGEWDDACAVTGIINQFDKEAHPRQATFWLKYDDKNLYIAQRSTLLPGEKKAPPVTLPFGLKNWQAYGYDRANVAEAMPPLYFKDNQNVVTIAVAPNRINSGDTPSWYRFMGNINSTLLNRRELCDQIKGVKFISISSVVDSLDVLKVPNNAKAYNSFSADDTVWESEYALPLGEMKVDKLPTGEEWGLLLARDYPQLDQNAIVSTTSYRFDWMARQWRNLAVANSYTLEKEYARARLSETDPVVQVLELGDLLGGKIKGHFAFSNPGAQPTSVTVKMTVGGKTIEQKIALAAGERKEWSSEEISATGPKAQTLQVAVANAEGKPLYSQSLPFRAGYARDRTTLVPDMWFSGEPKECGGQIVALPLYNPIRNILWAKLQLAGRPGEEARARAEVSIRRAGEEKPFVTYPMSDKPQGAGTYEVHTKLPELKPGLYEATASLFDKDSKLLARSRDLFIRYDHAKELPWIGNKIGIEDKVTPPWTPIVSKETAQGLDLSCWGRTYQIDGSGFPTQIQALDQNILTGPIHLEMTRDGKDVPLTAGKVSDLHAGPAEVNYKSSLQADGWTISTTAHFEYDGYLLYHVRLEPKDDKQSMDRLKFVIPLTPEQGRYLHAASGDPMRANVSTLTLKTEAGPLWDSSQQAAGPESNGILFVVGNFKPYVWVGGVKRGIAFLADNDKDWVPDDTKKVSAIEVVRTDKGVNLVLNLVARPFTFAHAREITFSLQATPVKPLPDDFRFARKQLNMGTAFVGNDPDGWSWDGCQLYLKGAIYLGGNGTAPFPLNRQRNREFNNGGMVTHWGPSVADDVVTKYMAMDANFHYPEIDDPMAPGLQGANWYGYLTPEIGAHHEIFDASISETEADYRIWRYQMWMKDVGMHGFYFDNSDSSVSANPDSGLGYVIDLPDRPMYNGRIQSSTAYVGIRNFLKRLHTVILDQGKRPYIWLHGTDSFVVSAYSFADFVLDGENGPNINPANPSFSDKWTPEHMQVLNDCSKWGFAMNMLEEMDGFSGPNNMGIWRTIYRDYSGYLMLYDSESPGVPYLDWDGLDLKRKAEFLPYWDAPVAAALQTGNDKVFASGWKQDGAVRVEIFNRSAEFRKGLNLTIDPKALGLAPGSGLVVKDVEAGIPKPVAPVDDPYIKWPGEVGPISSREENGKIIVTMDIQPHDFRLIRIEPPAAK